MGTDRFASRYLHISAPRAAAIALALTCALLGSLALIAAPAQAITKTFGFTGGEQTFVVPSGVTKLQALLVGGEGGGVGGLGAEVSAVLEVTPGQTLYVEVGGIGEDSGDGGEGGFNGGASGGGGAGGGGASDIRLLSLSMGLSIDSRLIIAAGGGGGAGDGETSAGGVGGDAGGAGETSEGGNEGGGAGTPSAGGGGGAGCASTGTTGELGSGGAGGAGFSANGGGGGAGGLYGGGGGGGGCGAGGGGGGGGSSLVPVGGALELALEGAEPVVAIAYTPPPPATPTGPTVSIPATEPPNTVLGFHPPKTVTTAKAKAKVKFTFSSTGAGASFRCRLDKGAYAPCASPKRLKVKPGKHKFSVAAVKDGVADPTPATFKFKVVKAP